MASFQQTFGLHLSAIGHTWIKPNAVYPPGNHPTGRTFSWEKGRIIHALQIIAIRQGRGKVQWLREQHTVKEGTAFIIKPGEWHRYRPSQRIGWVEDWFEIRGPLADDWLSRGLLEKRFCQLANPSRFFRQIDAMHQAVTDTGFLPEGFLECHACGLVAGIGMSQNKKGSTSRHSPESEMVAQARQMLSNNEGISTITKKLGVSYQKLYRGFKRFTGMSPKQFAERARLAYAEGLLNGEKLSVKEIASELGYCTASHFSLAFKSYYGLSPTAWRNKINLRSRF